MGRRGRVDDQRLGVADIGQVRQEFDAVDELLTGCSTALDAESEDGTGAFRQVFACQFMVAVVFQPGVIDPGDFRVILQVAGDGQGIGSMPVHAQRQGLDALQQQEGI